MNGYWKFLLILSIFLGVSISLLTSDAASSKATGKQNILVIMVKFPDVHPSFSMEQQQEKYFVKLNRYVKSISYEKAQIEGKMTRSREKEGNQTNPGCRESGR
jgi:hypothetical protein